MNTPRTILVVDRNQTKTRPLEQCLIHEGFRVLVEHQGYRAVSTTRARVPDLVILGTQLPDTTGWDTCTTLRQKSLVPIIVFTESNERIDPITGLEMGADDCLPRPVSCRELLAKIRAIFRRISFARLGGSPLFTIGDVQLDSASYKVFKRNQELTLRHKEYDLLHTFMSRAGQVMSREALINRVWGVDWLGDPRTLDVHIRWLRQKIEDDPAHPQYIQTVRGVGYRFVTTVEVGPVVEYQN